MGSADLERNGSNASAASATVAALRGGLRGRLVTSADADYDALRSVMRGDIDDHPLAMARVTGAEDIAHVIAVARESGLPLAVRSGGHSSAGHSTVEGGIVIDLREMTALDIDPVARTAWAEAGLTTAEVTSAAWEHALAIGFGDTGTVGIGGITLGGGIGFLVRKYGMTIDSLLAAEIVTADGSVLNVDESSHPDLFWAIRGGGGNFGVATRFKYRLAPMESFVGGMQVLPATAEVVAGFMKAADEAPDEMTTIANVMNCPPLPFVSDEYVGKLVMFNFMAFCGDDAAAAQAMAPFHDLAEPIADLVKPMPYPEMYQPDDGSYRPKALDRCLFMDSVDRDVAQTIIDRLEASDASLRAVQLRPLGGEMARVADDATAFAHRQRRIMAIAVNFFEGDEDYAKRVAWLDETVAAMDQAVPGVYVGFLRDEGVDRRHEAYPGKTWDRLSEVKARYDPENVFRLNQNIAPPGAGAQ